MAKVLSDQTSIFVRQQVVVDRLREMILSGELVGGDRLLEVSLSEQLEVSRTPIREALIVLAEEGLVDYRPNRGYVVHTFTLSYIKDAYVVREALEGLACRLAAERGIDEATFCKMDDLLQRSDHILATRGLSKEMRIPLREVNDQFHRFIVEASGNLALAQALGVATNIPYSSSRVSHWFAEDEPDGLFHLRTLHEQHHAILRAVRAGDGYRAETFMRSHIAGAAESISSRLKLDVEARPAPDHWDLKIVAPA